ncbi:unnamed protein product [Allacma fusca]|uniref:C2H2-type domain-containing protein n=1 Tax=Allacma fusca TaxID=39272 RepID=A0A8J2L127_9HEXA|nr:unnamed protein product [Allacma fusca]
MFVDNEEDTWEPYPNLNRMPDKVDELNQLLFDHCQKKYFVGSANKNEEFWYRKFQNQFMDCYSVLEDCVEDSNNLLMLQEVPSKLSRDSKRVQIKDKKGQNFNNEIDEMEIIPPNHPKNNKRKRPSSSVSANNRSGKNTNRNRDVQKLKQYSCNACTKSYASSSSLKRHNKCSHMIAGKRASLLSEKLDSVFVIQSRSEVSDFAPHCSSSIETTIPASNTVRDNSISLANCNLTDSSTNTKVKYLETSECPGSTNYGIACNACRRTFDDPMTLNIHLGKCLAFRRNLLVPDQNAILVNKEVQTNHCQLNCDAETQTEIVLDQPMEKEDNDIILNDGSNQFTCKPCKQYFASRFSYQRHQELKHMEGVVRKVLCELCKKYYKNLLSLKTHQQKSCKSI